ncbi:MAG TPA: ELM1/GtrOC1 family putative glycosyltransferase, partial [Alphaproteobacteria bacterium]|nr:ELM1/GtrOC1 family putative glycosyltransferase [Alphaproteobacteria bacterium]
MSSIMSPAPRCWVVCEAGLTGTENQCLGVAEALGIVPDIKRITLRQPWKTLAPWLGFTQDGSFIPPLR